jgi:hypothetical protein
MQITALETFIETTKSNCQWSVINYQY